MKLQLLIFFLFSILIYGCNSGANSNENNEKELLENDTISQEKPNTSDNKNIKIEHPKSIDKDYLILDNSVGKFVVGNKIPFPETSDNYKIKKEILSRMTEEGPTEETVYIVNQNGKDILNLNPEYDYNTGEYTQNIGEITVLSEIFSTADGIGVNSTIESFMDTYPDYKIWYTYVSGMYVIETSKIKVQFILDGKDFVGKLNITSDMITLKKSDFKSGSKILKIRLV